MITAQDKNELINLKGLNNTPVYDSNNIYYKEIIKQHLIGQTRSTKAEDILKTATNSRKLLYLLNNTTLNEDESDSYMYVNIFPYFFLNSTTQVTVKNFICYEINNQLRSDDLDGFFKNCQIIFYVLCDINNNNDIVSEIGAMRHDLLGQIIIDEFNYSNCFGTKLLLVSDEPSILDKTYAMRTIVFQNVTPNNITSGNIVVNNTGRR